MSALDAIAAISGQINPASAISTTTPCGELQQPNSISFGELLSRGVEQVEARVDHANEMVRAFALDDSVPVHEVTIALEEARIAVELAVQVRSRIVEGYREIMNMQL